MTMRPLLLFAFLGAVSAADRRTHGDEPPPTPPLRVMSERPTAAPDDEDATPRPQVRNAVAMAPMPAAPAATATPVEPAKPDATVAKLDALEVKVDRLQRGAHVGDGPYRDGPLLSVDGGVSLLERLRDVEKDLAASRDLAATRDARIKQLEQELATTQLRATRLNEQVDALSQAHDRLLTAQQELAQRGTTITSLKQQVDSLALARLNAERLYFLLAKSVMALNPGQTQDVLDLQQQVRVQARDLDVSQPEQP